MSRNNEVVRMNKKLNYEKKGPKAVILFHAFTGTPLDVNAVGKALGRENYTVMMPTLDGHDEEDPNEILKYGIKDWIKNGEEAYQTLKADGYTDISVFGLSLGGVIATHLMLNEDVKSYGVFSSPVISTSKTNVPKIFWQWYAFKMKKLGAKEADIQSKQSAVMNRLEDILLEINDYTEEMSKSYDSVELPVFIAQGGGDQMISAKQAGAFRDALTHAPVDFHCYEQAPHVITTGRIGKQLQKDLIAFLENNA